MQHADNRHKVNRIRPRIRQARTAGDISDHISELTRRRATIGDGDYSQREDNYQTRHHRCETYDDSIYQRDIEADYERETREERETIENPGGSASLARFEGLIPYIGSEWRE